MSRKKRKRFADLPGLPNTYDRAGTGLGGGWLRRHFGDDRPVCLELGCGKGEYSLAMSRLYPDTRVVGVDRKGDRIWKGATQALAEKLTNLVFLVADVEDVTLYFDEGQVSEIWLPFPDPLPKRRHAKHRLLSVPYLEKYRRLLKPDGVIHLKTDDEALYRLALEAAAEAGAVVLRKSGDLYSEPGLEPVLRIETTFERRHREVGRTIKYLSFTFETAAATRTQFEEPVGSSHRSGPQE